MTPAIGQLKAKKTVNCTVCTMSLTRNMKIYVYENSPEAIEKAKKELTLKLNKDYTCKVCASILKTNS
jgi:hypothetical protein